MVPGGAFEGGAVEGEATGGMKVLSLHLGDYLRVRAGEGGYEFYAHGASLGEGEERKRGLELRCKVLGVK